MNINNIDNMNLDTTMLMDTVLRALRVEDDKWYQEKLRNDIRNCSLSEVVEMEVIRNSIHTSNQMALRIRNTYGTVRPIELANALNISIVNVNDEIDINFLYLALYDPNNRRIVINDAVLTMVQHFLGIYKLNELTSVEDLLNSALYHEIFHALEDATPDIYTRSKMIKRKLVGLITYQRGLDGASEIGAIHFSKVMSDLGYSPCIFEKYILFMMNQISLDFLLPNV
jgi:hypothetical protein